MKGLFKLLFAFTLLLGIFLPNTEVIHAASKETYAATVNVKTTLNVREKPSFKSKIIGSLKGGSKVTVYHKTKSGWSEIRYKKKQAYVATKYLTFQSPGVTVSKYKYKNKSNIIYPQVKGPKKSVSDKVNKTLLEHTKKSYSAYVQLENDEKQDKKQSWCKEFPSMCNYEYSLSYSVKYNKSNKLSIVLDDYQYTGGVHGNNTLTSYNFDLKTGKQIKLNDILNTSKKRKNVQKYVYDYIKKHPRNFYEDVKQSDVIINNNTSFYYTDNGIAIQFQIYEVAPYSSGNPVVKVPSSVYK